jgi:curli biogenesis system outer membrane secretion channel CsgG
MSNSLFLRTAILTALLVSAVSPALTAADKEKGAKPAVMHSVALFPFEERGREAKDEGAKITDLLFAKLAIAPNVVLVDREDIRKLLDEQEVNLSGLVAPQQAIKTSQLTGAKLLITGSVLHVDNSIYLVAKIISSETSRVVGVSVKGNVRDDLGKLVDELSGEIIKTLGDRADDLVAKPLSREDRLADVKRKLGNAKRPAVLIEVPEHHIGQLTIDPAVETELSLYCTESGFKVIDAKEGRKKDADIVLRGEAFSEIAVRHGNLISVKARVELKAVNQSTGEVLVTDRQTTVGLDVTEQIAAKNALQEAGAQLAERMLPKIVEQEAKENRK